MEKLIKNQMKILIFIAFIIISCYGKQNNLLDGSISKSSDKS